MVPRISEAHLRYLVIETAISVVFNTFASFLISLVVFNGSATEPLSRILLDLIPQNFMVAFITVLIATVLTRRRRRLGKIDRLQGRATGFPSHAVLRAAGAGAVVAAITFPLLAGVLPAIAPSIWSSHAVLYFKCVDAALLALLITPPALQMALRD